LEFRPSATSAKSLDIAQANGADVAFPSNGPLQPSLAKSETAIHFNTLGNSKV